jgi:UDP-glucose 4-epimerase
MSTSPISKVLVTGGAGFIGSHLVERLVAAGKTVTVLDDCSTGRVENLVALRGNPRLRVMIARVSECNDLDSMVAGAEAVFHLAAAVGVELVVKRPLHTQHTNLRETDALFEVAAKHKTPVLLTSSSEVYGRSAKDVFSEQDDLLIGPPQQTRWGYACSKLADEFLAMAYAQERGLPVVVTRLFNIVGPRQTGQYGMVLPRFIAAAKAGLPLRVFGDGQQTRCFCHVTDAVECLLRLMQTPSARGQVFNVGGDEEVSILELATRVIRVLNSKSEVELVPYNEAYAPGFEDMRRRRPQLEKIVQAIGFRPGMALDDIIRRTAEGC